jgi:hypothetical protein
MIFHALGQGKLLKIFMRKLRLTFVRESAKTPQMRAARQTVPCFFILQLLVQSFHFQIWHMQQTTVHRCFQEGRVL